MAKMTVGELMTTELVTVRPNDDLALVMELLDEARVRHLPVVDRNGDLVGLVTDRDLARKVLGGTEELPIQVRRAQLSERTVSTVMVSSPETADPNDGIDEVAERMLENKFGCMPVVEGNRLVGIVTEADFVRLALES